MDLFFTGKLAVGSGLLYGVSYMVAGSLVFGYRDMNPTIDPPVTWEVPASQPTKLILRLRTPNLPGAEPARIGYLGPGFNDLYDENGNPIAAFYRILPF